MSPIAEPKLSTLPPALPAPDQKKEAAAVVKTEEGEASKQEGEGGGEQEEEEREHEEEERKRAEIDRLHRLGIPVPGVAVRVDKLVAKVWLEDLAIECANKLLADRVRAVVERAVEVTAPLWG